METITKYEPMDISVLVKAGIVPEGTPKEMVDVFAGFCREKNLSPVQRQVHLVRRGNKFTIQTGIDGFRTLAERTEKYAGSDDYLFDEGLTEFQMIKEGRNKPITATATIHKLLPNGQIFPSKATARWDEYYPGEQLGFMWKKMPFLMLGKCAEALALRKAFPEALSGVYADEEMQQANGTQQQTEAVRDLTDDFSKCQTKDELKSLWGTLNETEKKEYYKLKEQVLTRIVKDNIEEYIGKLKTNTYESWANTIEIILDNMEAGEERDRLINMYNTRLEQIKVEHRYEPLPFK